MMPTSPPAPSTAPTTIPTHNVKVTYEALKTQIDTDFRAAINTGKMIQSFRDTDLKTINDLIIQLKNEVAGIGLATTDQGYQAEFNRIQADYDARCVQAINDAADSLMADPKLKADFVAKNQPLGAAPADPAIRAEYVAQLRRQAEQLAKLDRAQTKLDKLLDDEAKELAALRTRETRLYQIEKVQEIHAKYQKKYDAAIDELAPSPSPPMTPDAIAVRDEERRQLAALKKIYDDKIKNEHDAQMRYINTIFDEMARLKMMADVALRRRGMSAGAMTADELKKVLAEPAKYRSDNKDIGLLETFFLGPWGTAITFDGTSYHFNPMDDAAVDKIIEEAIAHNYHNGTFTITLGTKLKHTQMFAEMGPDNDFELNRRALYLYMLTACGIKVAMDKNSPKARMFGRAVPNGDGKPEYTAAEVLDKYKKTGEILDPKAYASIMHYPVFKNVVIDGFTPTPEQQRYIDEYQKLRKAYERIAIFEMVRQEGYKVVINHTTVPEAKDIELGKLYLYFENNTIKYATLDVDGSIRVKEINDKDLGARAAGIRAALQAPGTDLKIRERDALSVALKKDTYIREARTGLNVVLVHGPIVNKSDVKLGKVYLYLNGADLELAVRDKNNNVERVKIPDADLGANPDALKAHFARSLAALPGAAAGGVTSYTLDRLAPGRQGLGAPLAGGAAGPLSPVGLAGQPLKGPVDPAADTKIIIEAIAKLGYATEIKPLGFDKNVFEVDEKQAPLEPDLAIDVGAPANKTP